MPKIEKAYYATSLGALRKSAGGYDRVYFGAEFCQWRLPAPAAVRKAFGIADEMGIGFTLMTPWVTDAGIRKLRGLFSGLVPLVDNAVSPVEVVVNDFGVLTMLKEEFPSLVPVLGRLLARQKRCPRVPGAIESIPEPGRDVYMHAGIEDPLAAGMLKRYGVKRVELDGPLQGMEVDLRPARLKGSVYTPYVFVTVTRHCPASFDATSWQSFTGCKIMGCTKNVLSLNNPDNGSRLLMRGNAQFVENLGAPNKLTGTGIDRIVYMEDLP